MDVHHVAQPFQQLRHPLHVHFSPIPPAQVLKLNVADEQGPTGSRLPWQTYGIDLSGGREAGLSGGWVQGAFLGRQLTAEKGHGHGNHISLSLGHLPTSPALLPGPWLPLGTPCLLWQVGQATLQLCSHLCPQHLVSLCVPDALVLAQGALPDPLLALDADEGPGGRLSAGGGQLRTGGPCKQKAPQLQWEVPAVREDCRRARPASTAGLCPLGVPVQPRGGRPPPRALSPLHGKEDSAPQSSDTRDTQPPLAFRLQTPAGARPPSSTPPEAMARPGADHSPASLTRLSGQTQLLRQGAIALPEAVDEDLAGPGALQTHVVDEAAGLVGAHRVSVVHLVHLLEAQHPSGQQLIQQPGDHWLAHTLHKVCPHIQEQLLCGVAPSVPRAPTQRLLPPHRPLRVLPLPHHLPWVLPPSLLSPPSC